MAIQRTPPGSQPPRPPAPTDAAPSPATEPGAATSAEATPSQGVPDEARQIDQFEGAPGASFTNQLLGLDTNADGQLSRQELEAGAETLQQLATDGREADMAESSVLRLLMAESSQGHALPLAFAVERAEGGQLQLVAAGQDDPAVTLALSSEAPAAQDEILLQGPTATVIHGDDPGDFYCEHMFFTSQLEASRPDSSVVTNAQGEKLVGFLHVPRDRYATQAEPSGYTQAERHEGTRQVIGAALRGYYDQATSQVDEGPVKLLVSGYEQFQWIRNNPTGDFTSHQENLDASMQQAFGDALLTSTGTLVPPEPGAPSNAQTYRYEVRDPDSGESREVLLTRAQFSVDDHAISAASETSIQQVMAHTQPHGVIAMGVAGYGNYKAEHHADSGGLQRDGDSASHVDGAAATVQLRDNYSLARAIQAGSR